MAVSAGGKAVGASSSVEGGRLRIVLDREAVVEAGAAIDVEIEG